jgi:hypothetical protein
VTGEEAAEFLGPEVVAELDRQIAAAPPLTPAQLVMLAAALRDKPRPRPDANRAADAA